ncbi:MAG TPA: adenylate/guanylate cyclase domain-containing protein [Dehalococcoidia bacterium]|nr:adenylate/guanylate cyclase domain-containing protein [Dehalococcoidia bacterium]
MARVMEPRIQYAKTADGVSIAYTQFGDGPPVIMTSFVGWSHLGWEWRLPEWAGRFSPGWLSETHTVVRFDIRGSGLSERNINVFGLDNHALDLAAVADDLKLDRFALLGPVYGGPIAIAYAAQHPERVSHLALYCSYATGEARSAQAQTATSLVDKDWVLFTETIAHASLGWEADDMAHSLAMYMRESVTPEAYKEMAVGSTTAPDISQFLARITVPTLVVHLRELAFPDVSHARYLASQIRGSRLVLLEGKSVLEADSEGVRSTISEFFSDGEPRQASPEVPAKPGAFRTVLFTDLVGHTEMMQRLGDERGREVLREHERITREVLKAHGGTEVKTMGDGFMASFGSVTKAVECAVALQREIGNWQSEIGERIAVRCGLNAGEPIEEDGDLFGATVILASRIAAKAEGGEILVADTVRGLCSGKGFVFADRGEFVAKGFDEPLRVYEVRWRDA